ncbi:hypothetical protein E0493_08435 [Roseomonas sp. M0104]|uniref:Uncharacterized protein n=1 Tax=Teichococcus coralli TaxID=2545983 RepID=A0A845B9W5_9PROT|nr:hypothetical protein [Pseudoroseomonas coralli]MXP63378.1 hypothetical protein [Pseudoroseomonas coralli]
MDQAAALFAFPQNPEDRLRLALRRLDAALSEQADAVARFRGSLSDLRTAVGGLAGQVQNYRATLDETAAKVRHTHEAALELGRTADRMATLA